MNPLSHSPLLRLCVTTLEHCVPPNTHTCTAAASSPCWYSGGGSCPGRRSTAYASRAPAPAPPVELLLPWPCTAAPKASEVDAVPLAKWANTYPGHVNTSSIAWEKEGRDIVAYACRNTTAQ